jgi:putative hydrolase of the HAD superfamily
VRGDIDTLLLDAGGVLVRPDPAQIRAAMRAVDLRPTPDEIARAHYVGVASIDTSPPACDEEGLPLYVEGLARGLHVPPSRRALAERLLAEGMRTRVPWSDVVEESRVALLELAAIPQLAIAVVSNSYGWIEGTLRDLAICQVGPGAGAEINAVIDSHEVGSQKPDPRIFSAALDALGRSATGALHVGDSVHFDVRGARAAGLGAAHFDPFGVCGGDDHDHVATLAEVRRLISR